MLEERRQSSLSAGTSEMGPPSGLLQEQEELKPVEICETITLPAQVHAILLLLLEIL